MQILHTEPVSIVWIDNIVCFLAAKTISVYIYVIINIEWNAHLNYKWHVSVLHRQFSILKFRRAPFRVRHIHLWGKVLLLTNINSHILKRGIRLYFSLPFNWYFAGMRGREKKKTQGTHFDDHGHITHKFLRSVTLPIHFRVMFTAKRKTLLVLTSRC